MAVMQRLVRVLLIASMLVGATGTVGAAEKDLRDPVFVESSEILYLESYPVQVQLLVQGALPTPCHQPAWEVSETATSVDVALWSTSDPDAFCASVLEPVELAIPLGSYESADLDVTLDGELVGRIRIVDGGDSPMSRLAGAGWSFGLCTRYCSADLTIDGTALTQSGRDREAETALYVNRGELTPTGREQIDVAVAALDGVALEATYGCPDCADGGAAYVSLDDGASVSRHDMEFGSPPAVLKDVFELSMRLMASLETCQDSELVTIAEDCVAYQR